MFARESDDPVASENDTRCESRPWLAATVPTWNAFRDSRCNRRWLSVAPSAIVASVTAFVRYRDSPNETYCSTIVTTAPLSTVMSVRGYETPGAVPRTSVTNKRWIGAGGAAFRET